MLVLGDKKCKFPPKKWVCTDPLCGNRNYQWRKTCNKCLKSRDEYVPPIVKVIGEKAAEKSEGIFTAQDWQCKGCGNVNWARRQTCNRCETNKFDPINIIHPDDELFEEVDEMSVHSSLSSPPKVDSDCTESGDTEIRGCSIGEHVKLLTLLSNFALAVQNRTCCSSCHDRPPAHATHQRRRSVSCDSRERNLPKPCEVRRVVLTSGSRSRSNSTSPPKQRRETLFYERRSPTPPPHRRNWSPPNRPLPRTSGPRHSPYNRFNPRREGRERTRSERDREHHPRSERDRDLHPYRRFSPIQHHRRSYGY